MNLENHKIEVADIEVKVPDLTNYDLSDMDEVIRYLKDMSKLNLEDKKTKLDGLDEVKRLLKLLESPEDVDPITDDPPEIDDPYIPDNPYINDDPSDLDEPYENPYYIDPYDIDNPDDDTDPYDDVDPWEVSEPDDDVEPINDMPMYSEIRTDVPNVGRAIVTGDPYGVAEKLDHVQGDEVYGASGTCGLTSVANLFRLRGEDVTEGDIVRYAMENDLCVVDPTDPGMTGGTSIFHREQILDNLGMESTSHFDYGSEEIAEAIEQGRGVIIAVNAGKLWDDPRFLGNSYGAVSSNHAITVTGVARDADTGEVAGFYVCDSGRGLESDANRYVSIDEFDEMYTDVLGSNAVVTDDPIRVV